MKKAVVIVPTYNEKENVKTLIPQIFDVAKKIKNWDISILVVDDHSPDKTAEEIKKIAKKYKNLHLLMGKKAGLGNAYLRGFRWVLNEKKYDVLFEMDADWSHDPGLIPQFLQEIDRGADFVIGSRYIRGGSIPSDWAAHRKLFSTAGNLIVKYGMMKRKINDWTSGFRAIRTNFVKDIIGKMNNFNGYVFQVALLNNAEMKGLKITEVPLRFEDRKKGISKINAAQYIINTLTYVFTNSAFIKYVIVGLIGFTIDFGISYIGIERLLLPVWLATLLSTETAIISNFILNNFWTFSYKQIERSISVYISKFINFNIVSAGSILIQTVAMQITTSFLPKNYWPFYKAGIILFLVIPYSWVMYNRFIWAKKKA